MSSTPPSLLSKLPYYNECKGAYFIFLFTLLLIFAYGLMLRFTYGNSGRIQGDALNRNVIDVPGVGPCSWWPISHFILFMILGILFPHCDILIIGAGILWELFEASMSIIERRTHQTVNLSDGVQYNYSWWAGSFKDILMNIAGFYVGKSYRILWESLGGPFPFGCATCKEGNGKNHPSP